jgi:uncharacterized protein YecE (DUF72 family)
LGYRALEGAGARRQAGAGVTAWIGVAGWSLRREQQDLFGEGASHLARYATRLGAVEINSSFYRPHQRKTYERWAASVPRDFRFSAKLPRAITHDARLKNIEKPLAAFLEQVGGLGEKLGPLLVQLPPSLGFEPQIAAGFFAGLRARFDGLLACEPRQPGADKPGGWRGFSYFRWHGSPVMYRSDYPAARLAVLAAQLEAGDWCIFDNTADGAATLNALSLQKQL